MLTSHRALLKSIALDLVKRVLIVLPSHRLRELSLPSDLALDGPLMMQIATNQQNLEDVDWPIVFTHLKDTLSSPLVSSDWLASLHSTSLPETVGSIDDLVGYNLILRTAKRLKTLGIGSNKISGTEACLQPDEFAQTLFSHIAPFGKEDMLIVESLSLTDLAVGAFEQSYLRVYDWHAIKSLAVWGCPGTHNLLDHLASRFEEQPAKLRSFECVVAETTRPQQLSRFLRQWAEQLSSYCHIMPTAQT